MGFDFPEDCASLRSTLGVYGIQTRLLDTAHDVIDVTNKLFDLNFDFGFDDGEDHDILLRQQETLQSMGRDQRKLKVATNVRKIPSKLFGWKPDHMSRIAKTRNDYGMKGKW